MPFCWLFFKVEFVPWAGPSFPGSGSLSAKLLLLQLSLCESSNGGDGPAAVWPVPGTRKWQFLLCPALATSGALQLMKLGCVSGHSTRVWAPWLHQLCGSRYTWAARRGVGYGNRLCRRDIARDFEEGVWGLLTKGVLWVPMLCPPAPCAHYHAQEPPFLWTQFKAW